MRAYLEITNVCNRACSFCPGTTREKTFADPAKIADRLRKLKNGGVDELCLHLMGEPLLHPAFPEIASLCNAADIPVILTTNGTLLDAVRSEILLKTPVFRQINFSIQALRPDEMQLLDNILAFCNLALIRRPELYLNLRLWNLEDGFSARPENEPFLDRIFQACSAERPANMKLHPGWKSIPVKGRLYVHFSSLFQWPSAFGPEQKQRAFCRGLSSQIGILADGTVVPCCLDSDGTVPLGNLDHSDLSEILTSPRAVAILDGFRTGRAAEKLCRSCSYRTRFSR